LNTGVNSEGCSVPTGTCESDTCADAVNLTSAGEACENGVPCNRMFDNVFCEGLSVEQCGFIDSDGGEFDTPFGNDMWFSYTTRANESGEITATTCQSGNFDTVIAVYDGGPVSDGGGCLCAADAMMDCGDDTCGADSLHSSAKFDVVPNRCYLIRVGGYEDGVGMGQLNLFWSGPQSSQGPEPSNSKALSGGNEGSDDATATARPCLGCR